MGRRNLPHFIYIMRKISYLKKSLEKIFVEVLKNSSDTKTQILYFLKKDELIREISRIELKIDKIILELDNEK